MALSDRFRREEEMKRRVEAARRLPIQDVAALLGLQVIRSCRGYTQVYCPFHNGDSGVLVHNDKYNLFKCHAGCAPRSTGKGKPKSAFDTLDLVITLQGIGFLEALDFLLGKPLPRSTSMPTRRAMPVVPLPQSENPVGTEQIDEYHNRLMLSAEGDRALSYLAARGIERRTAIRWRLGLRPRWEGNLAHLADSVPGFADVLAAFKKKDLSLSRQHDILALLCDGGLDDRQLAWISGHLDTQLLIEEYGQARHFRSWRLVIPVWADGPPQDGSGQCFGLRFRQVPGLTPSPVVHPGCALRERKTDAKHQLLEILPDGAYRLRLKRDPSAEPFVSDPSLFKSDDTKCWGRGHVRTLAANRRSAKRFAIAVEGEIDLLSLDQALLATPLHANSWLISSTNGASNFPSEWSNTDFWKPFSRIYFAYDRDPAGKQALAKMRTEGLTLDSRSVPCGKDFNEWLVARGGQIPQDELHDWIGKLCWFARPYPS